MHELFQRIHEKSPPKRIYRQFWDEKECLVILKRLELRNEHFKCLDKTAFWGTDSLSTFPISELCDEKKLFFCFSEKTCPPCIDTVVDMLHSFFTDDEIKTQIVFVSPDYPVRLRNDCYGKRLLNLCDKKIGLPIEQEEALRLSYSWWIRICISNIFIFIIKPYRNYFNLSRRDEKNMVVS